MDRGFVVFLADRSSVDCEACFRGGVRKRTLAHSKACLFAGGCWLFTQSSCKSCSNLERLEVAVADRYGELTALGTLESGILRLGIAPVFCHAGEMDVVAMLYVNGYAEPARTYGKVWGALAASYTRRATRQQTENKVIIVQVTSLSGVVLKQRTQ